MRTTFFNATLAVVYLLMVPSCPVQLTATAGPFDGDTTLPTEDSNFLAQSYIEADADGPLDSVSLNFTKIDALTTTGDFMNLYQKNNIIKSLADLWRKMEKQGHQVMREKQKQTFSQFVHENYPAFDEELIKAGQKAWTRLNKWGVNNSLTLTGPIWDWNDAADIKTKASSDSLKQQCDNGDDIGTQMQEKFRKMLKAKELAKEYCQQAKIHLRNADNSKSVRSPFLEKQDLDKRYKTLQQEKLKLQELWDTADNTLQCTLFYGIRRSDFWGTAPGLEVVKAAQTPKSFKNEEKPQSNL